MKPKRTKTPSPVPRKQILVVDDHPLMCEGVARWIDDTADLQVCGRAESASQAVSLVEKLKPDLVLTDIALTGRSGLELIKDLRTLQPDLPDVRSVVAELEFQGTAPSQPQGVARQIDADLLPHLPSGGLLRRFARPDKAAR